MAVDFMYQGRISGDVGDRLLAANMDYHALQPWVDKYGRSLVALRTGYDRVKNKPILKTQLCNTTGVLLRDQWLEVEGAVFRAARPQLRVWGDLVGSGLTLNIPNGMEITVLLHQTMGDAGEATMSMDAMRETNRDRVEYGLDGIPLPIVHSDFSFSLREIAVSRRQGIPLDTTMVEQATRKCVEQIEKLTIGTASSYSYAGYSVYGLTNFPYRIVKVITAPSAGGWTPQTLITELLDTVQSLQDFFFNGSLGIWYSPAFTQYLDNDYSDTYGGKTLRQRVNDIDDIKFFRKADYLTGFSFVMVQLTPDVIQAITGMPLRTLQWDAAGGMEKRFKVMGIMVPRVRRNQNGNAGIVHASS